MKVFTDQFLQEFRPLKVYLYIYGKDGNKEEKTSRSLPEGKCEGV